MPITPSRSVGSAPQGSRYIGRLSPSCPSSGRTSNGSSLKGLPDVSTFSPRGLALLPGTMAVGVPQKAGVSELYEELRPLMFSIAYRMVGTASDAGDRVTPAPQALGGRRSPPR
jgi:hypothetical protein